jgi:hypothetical protein
MERHKNKFLQTINEVVEEYYQIFPEKNNLINQCKHVKSFM